MEGTVALRDRIARSKFIHEGPVGSNHSSFERRNRRNPTPNRRKGGVDNERD